MSTEKRIEQLRLGIAKSKLLDEREKGDWLNLLELMNDKQLGELEEILNGISPVVTKEPEKGPTLTEEPKKSALPVLSHISNMPTEISFDKPQPYVPPPISKVVAPAPAPKPIPAPALSTTPTTSTTPIKHSPFNFPAPSKSAPVVMPPKMKVPDPVIEKPVTQPKPIKTQAPVFSVPLKSVTPQSTPKPIPASAPAPSQTQPASKQQLKINNLDDIAKLDLTILRAIDTSNLVRDFQQLVMQYGYFNVLQSFESSRLYKSYLTRGKSILAGESTEGKFTVNQSEFELIADILLSIRINRQQ